MDIKQILDLLNSDVPEDIREGAYLAGDFQLVEALPRLVKKLEIPNPGIQEAVDGALRKIGGKPVISVVLPLLRSEDAPVRNIAMDVLREVGGSDVTTLAELLNDDDPDLRIFGSDILGSTGSALAVPLLSRALLMDPEVNVRYQAAISLGTLAFPEAADALNKALKDEEWVRFAVIESLIKIRAESSVSALLMALDKSSELVAANIVEALGEMGYIKAAPMLIKRLPKSTGPLANKIVRAIIQLVGAKSLKLLESSEYNALVDYMHAALEDEDEQIQDAAIEGLATTKSPKAFESIFKLLSGLNPEREHERMQHIVETLAGMGYYDLMEHVIDEGDEQQKMLLVDILSFIDDHRVIDLLKNSFWRQTRDVQRATLSVLAAKCAPDDRDFFADLLDKVTDGTMIKMALHFFGKNKENKLIYEKVWPFLFHKYPDVQEAALEAAMSTQGPKIRQRFIEMTRLEEIFKRQMGYYALRVYNDDADIVPYLAQGLKDESPDVRRIAIESLGHTSCPLSDDRMGLLAACLADNDKDVRLAVIDVFGMCTDKKSEQYLIQGLSDNDPWIRARCAESLGNMHDESLAPELAKLLEDDQPLVVVKTIEALVELGGKAAFKYLLTLMEHPEPEIQRAAEEAIERIRQGMGE